MTHVATGAVDAGVAALTLWRLKRDVGGWVGWLVDLRERLLDPAGQSLAYNNSVLAAARSAEMSYEELELLAGESRPVMKLALDEAFPDRSPVEDRYDVQSYVARGTYDAEFREMARFASDAEDEHPECVAMLATALEMIRQVQDRSRACDVQVDMTRPGARQIVLALRELYVSIAEEAATGSDAMVPFLSEIKLTDPKDVFVGPVEKLALYKAEVRELNARLAVALEALGALD